MRTNVTSPAKLAGAALRLFDPALEPAAGCSGGGPLLSPDMRVEEFCELYVLPVVGKACDWARGTIKSVNEATAYWTALSGDPAIGGITPFHCADFVAGLRVQEARSCGDEIEYLATATVIKHCASIQRLLNIAGPSSARRSKRDLRRFGAGLIAAPPWIEAPDPDDLLPNGDFELAEVAAILQACPRMTVPLYAPDPAVWWKALVSFLCVTGLRIGTAMLLEWEMISDQMLLIPGAIAKKRKKQVKYLHPKAYELIAPLRGLSKRVFAVETWPAPGAQRWVHACRRQLLELAELPEARRFGFHGFRRLHATDLWEIDELAAQESMNHADIATTRGFYANATRQLKKSMSRQQAAIDQLPVLAIL